MAVGLKSRIIYREKIKEDNATDYWKDLLTRLREQV